MVEFTGQCGVEDIENVLNHSVNALNSIVHPPLPALLRRVARILPDIACVIVLQNITMGKKATLTTDIVARRGGMEYAGGMHPPYDFRGGASPHIPPILSYVGIL